MTTKSRTGAHRCCQYRELAARLGSAPPRSVLPRSRSTVGSARRRRFRITGSVPKYLRCRRSYTSLLLHGLTSRPTSRMILWVAHAPARRGPRRGVLAAAPDSKSVPCFASSSERAMTDFVVVAVRWGTSTIFNWTRKMWSLDVDRH
jgi:hypothetical protein